MESQTSFRNLDIENLELEEGFFDGIVFNNTLDEALLDSPSLKDVKGSVMKINWFEKLLDKFKKDQVSTINVLKLPSYDVRHKMITMQSSIRIDEKPFRNFVKGILKQKIIIEKLYYPSISKIAQLERFLSEVGPDFTKRVDIFVENLQENIKDKLNCYGKINLHVPPAITITPKQEYIKNIPENKFKTDKPKTYVANEMFKGNFIEKKGAGETFCDSESLFSGKPKWRESEEYYAKLNDTRRIIDTWCKGEKHKGGLSKGYICEGENNIRILFLDSGVCLNHRAFNHEKSQNVQWNYPITRNKFMSAWNKCKIIAFKSFDDVGKDELCARDKHGHGTHCASIAAGLPFEMYVPKETEFYDREKNNPVNWRGGVAPFAQILSGKIVNDKGISKPVWMADALKHFLDEDELKFNNEYFHIICTSVGYNFFSEELRQQISRATMQGKIFICAASNEGKLNTTNIAYPGRFGDVICVGASCRKGQATNFSPIGREIDCLALGENVWGASANDSKSGIAMDGTSQAAPYIAGICALVLLAAQRLGGVYLRRKIQHTAVMKEILKKMSSHDGTHKEGEGYGNVNPLNILKSEKSHFLRIIAEIYNKSIDELECEITDSTD
ncbi:DgyrCDS5592 [Dimorphilus gyrociliatus]|uniref:DgyrCDS5592 n=1 Tax=Dimorphilus gyrociliatus TaxID=2664684 RepID=A0A7I8VKF4_9ANNE|nr:DgyrCDS5592 [Dimorphilus gyrociliatus]